MAAVESLSNEHEKLVLSLPKTNGWLSGDPFYEYKGFWYNATILRGVLNSQLHFKALPSDILIVSTPKSGTTWLMALLFSVVHRHRHPVTTPNHHPLTTHHPHDLVPLLENKLYRDNPNPDLSDMLSPRLFATHLPENSLPSSVRESKCKIVCICRDPKDVFVSFWHFAKYRQSTYDGTTLHMDDIFELFCQGISLNGPYWDHVLGYWKASLERPSEVLFLKYEDVKQDPGLCVKRLAEFSGCPFSPEEEKDGVADLIVKMCSFEILSELEVNKTGEVNKGMKNSAFFRRGQVGDWTNYLTPEMGDKLNKITAHKFRGSGLNF